MHRKFITLIVSAAVAVAGFSAPARADGDDIAKALIGFTALALIAKAIDDKNDRATTHYPAPPIYGQPGRPRSTASRGVRRSIRTRPARPTRARCRRRSRAMTCLKAACATSASTGGPSSSSATPA
ncbi:hypothetical protein ACFSZS_23125 [Seohaeicola zhoushanensis]